MTFQKLAKLGAVAAVFAATFMAGAFAQTQHTVWKWPMSTEAVNAAPNNHHVLFENDHVRLLEVTVQPGQTEPVHGHMYPSVFAMDAVQASLNDHVIEGNSTTRRPRMYEDADWSQPQCRTMPIQGPHQVSDTDTFPVHFYRLEFKKMDGKSIETDWAQYKR